MSDHDGQVHIAGITMIMMMMVAPKLGMTAMMMVRDTHSSWQDGNER